MAITFTSIRIVNPPSGTRQPCVNGRFILDIEVKGRTDGAGGRYAVDVYDQDPGIIPDDKLETVAVPAIAPNTPFTIVTQAQLECNANCHVAGAIRSSGEADAEIYAFAREQGAPAANNITSAQIMLHCGDPPKDEKRRRDRR